jgi:general stress protein 26
VPVELQQVKEHSKALSDFVHVATVGPDGEPDVAPVHPAWLGDTLWIMSFASSVKVRNIKSNPKVALHWQVTEKGDGVALWGTAEVFTDVDTKKRLWEGVFDYNLTDFSPGGPENSPDSVFVAVTPRRAVYVIAFGMGGIERWSAA